LHVFGSIYTQDSMGFDKKQILCRNLEIKGEESGVIADVPRRRKCVKIWEHHPRRPTAKGPKGLEFVS